MEVIEMTVKAWASLERSVFQAAWVACGYFTYADLAKFDKEVDPSMLNFDQAKEEVSDVFTVCGKGPFTPQRCTRYEWQLQDMGQWVGVSSDVHLPNLTWQ